MAIKSKKPKEGKKPEKKVYLTKQQVEDILKTLKGIQEEKLDKRETKEKNLYRIEITKEDLKRAEFTLGKSKLLEMIEDEIKQGTKPNLETITKEAENKISKDNKKDEYKKDQYGNKQLYSDEIGVYNKEKAEKIPDYSIRKDHSTT